MFQVGDRLHNDRYEILNPLGQGGFSQTFEVDDGGTIKVLKVLSESYPKAVALFQREFKVLSQLRHPGVPLVETDGYFMVAPTSNTAGEPIEGDPAELCHCLIMERVPGVDLRQWLRQRENEPAVEDTVLDWLVQLAEILAQIHQHHCFHRDIKPSNIMLRPDGQLVLIDFGAVREVTETFLHKQQDDVTSTHLYSRGYTPMEQMQGRAVPQSDFFALGRTFVHLLTGCNPLDFSTDFETGALLWREHAPHVSLALADLLDRLMAPFVAKRPSDPTCLISEIVAVQSKIANQDTDYISCLLDGAQDISGRSEDRIDVGLYGFPQRPDSSTRPDPETSTQHEGTVMPPELLTNVSRLSSDVGAAWSGGIAQDGPLQGRRVQVAPPSSSTPMQRQQPHQQSSKWMVAGLCSLVATTGIMGVRLLGLLQGMELAVFDQMMRSRPAEPLDDRMMLITIDNDDLAYQDAQGFSRQGSLSDEALTQLLTKLQPHQPRGIGIDIYLPSNPSPAQASNPQLNDGSEPGQNREANENGQNSGNVLEQPVVANDGYREALREADQVVAVCAIGGGQQDLPSISPPSEVSLDRVGFSNIPYDPDRRVRRQLVGMSPDQVCDTSRSLSTQLVAAYLESENIDSGQDDDGTVYIGDRRIPAISDRLGGYQHPSMLRDGGYQVLINYRANPELAVTYSLSDLLQGILDDDLSELVRDRIVLVGTIERTFNDYHLTPYGDLPGVVIQGHMTSQILAAVLDNRPLLWGFPIWGDALWIFGWAGMTGILLVIDRLPNAWQRQGSWLKAGAIVLIIGSLSGVSFIVLLNGGWMPLVPTLGAIALTSLGLKLWPRWTSFIFPTGPDQASSQL